MVIISILATLLLPALAQVQARARRTACISNLKQLGIGFHSFAHEHNNKFPMQVSTNDGGSLELLRAATNASGIGNLTYRHFQTLSNELVTPLILHCPADTRSPASNFQELKNENISYFIGMNAEYAKVTTILAGDRTLTRLGPAYGSILYALPDSPMEWAAGLHPNSGNLLFADAHVETCKKQDAQTALAQAGKVSLLFTPSMASAYPVHSTDVAKTNSPSSQRQTEEIGQPGKTNQGTRAGTLAGANVPNPAATVVKRSIAAGERNQPTPPAMQAGIPEVKDNNPDDVEISRLEPELLLKRLRLGLASFSSKNHYWLLFLLLALAAAMEVLRRRLRQRQRLRRAQR